MLVTCRNVFVSTLAARQEVTRPSTHPASNFISRTQVPIKIGALITQDLDLQVSSFRHHAPWRFEIGQGSGWMPSKPSELQGIRKIGDPGTCRSNKNHGFSINPTKVNSKETTAPRLARWWKPPSAPPKEFSLPLNSSPTKRPFFGKAQVTSTPKKELQEEWNPELDIWATPRCPRPPCLWPCEYLCHRHLPMPPNRATC